MWISFFKDLKKKKSPTKNFNSNFFSNWRISIVVTTKWISIFCSENCCLKELQDRTIDQKKNPLKWDYLPLLFECIYSSKAVKTQFDQVPFHGLSYKIFSPMRLTTCSPILITQFFFFKYFKNIITELVTIRFGGDDHGDI